MGLDGLVGVRGEGSVDAVDTRFDSLAPAFSSSLWAMNSQLEERSVLTVDCEIAVATERVEGGRELAGGTRVCAAARPEGGLSSFTGSVGETVHNVTPLPSDSAM